MKTEQRIREAGGIDWEMFEDDPPAVRRFILAIRAALAGEMTDEAFRLEIKKALDDLPKEALWT